MAELDRRTVDLSAYPDLVVIYLGMCANTFRGIATLLKFGPRISASVAAKPDGLLLHEQIIYSIFPPHLGMRQYWRDFESLEKWARSLPHQVWWRDFFHDSGGTGFWHEAYFKKVGMEAIYDDLPVSLGFSGFAPVVPAKGAMFSARRRAGVAGQSTVAPVVSEKHLDDDAGRRDHA